MAGWTAIAAAGALALGGCSAPPPPPFAIFDTEAGEQDTLPDWVSLQEGGDEVRYLATNGTARYHVSRSGTTHCLVVVAGDEDDNWSAGCSGGLGQGLVVTGNAPGVPGTAALVVDGYTERNPEAAEGWEQLHENVLYRNALGLTAGQLGG